MGKRRISIKSPLYVWNYLEEILKMERLKLRKCPVQEDINPKYKRAQLWGYVVIGYSLLEQSLKVVLHICNKEPEVTHSLFKLFQELPSEVQGVLQEYYDDLYKNLPEMRLPSRRKRISNQIGRFLKNLDKCRDARGSLEWRYSPTQRSKGGSLPPVHIELMHEIVFGCVRLISSIVPKYTGRAVDLYTYSWIRRYEINDKVVHWLLVRQQWPREGDDLESDRIETLCRPDLDGQCEYLVFKDGQLSGGVHFGDPSKAKEGNLKIVNKQGEFDAFDFERDFEVTITRQHPLFMIRRIRKRS